LQQAGYQTAAGYQWPVILSGLRKYYEDIAEYVPVAKNTDKDWVQCYSAGDLLNPQEQGQIENYLAHTDADKVFFPVVHATAAGLVISWEVLAKRKNASGTGCEIKVGWGIDGSKLNHSWGSASIAGLYGQGAYELAMAEAQRRLDGLQDKLVKAVYVRWQILCLMRLRLYNQALELTERTLVEHPLYTDLLYLAAEIAIERGFTDTAQMFLGKCLVMQDAADYPEYFCDIAARAAVLLSQKNSDSTLGNAEI
jgi:hypothetical protein